MPLSTLWATATFRSKLLLFFQEAWRLMPVADTILRPAKAALLARASGMEPILKTENLWKVYLVGRVDAAAPQGGTFSVLPGKFVCVMRASGCGKCTLWCVSGRLARATRATVLVDGNDLAAMTDAER